ncbi:hypothetical protein [Roseateles saccharophilus]|uniref:Uncharacterized protein n=1 Tax=Roseateles saccharophilus TaxID=304 RepID=A0A4R3VMP6_ROSSA|nr:hypothetical protein [Roseateles saccharophilus]TCV04445.1 hypothetical protein EV671_1001200 [Roseateles saccharophilus]
MKPVLPMVLERVAAFVALNLQRKSLSDQKDDCERLLADYNMAFTSDVEQISANL